jgi:hypothetical protein
MAVTRAFPVPPDIHGVDNVAAWFTDPPGVIIQMLEPSRGTKAMADWMVGPGLDRLRSRFPHAQRLYFVLDVSAMNGRDPAARVVLMDKAREIAGLFEHSFVIPPLKANPVYTATLHAAAALLSAFGVKLEIASSLADVIARCKLKPAGPAGRSERS